MAPPQGAAAAAGSRAGGRNLHACMLHVMHARGTTPAEASESTRRGQKRVRADQNTSVRTGTAQCTRARARTGYYARWNVCDSLLPNATATLRREQKRVRADATTQTHKNILVRTCIVQWTHTRVHRRVIMHDGASQSRFLPQAEGTACLGRARHEGEGFAACAGRRRDLQVHRSDHRRREALRHGTGLHIHAHFLDVMHRPDAR